MPARHHPRPPPFRLSSPHRTRLGISGSLVLQSPFRAHFRGNEECGWPPPSSLPFSGKYKGAPPLFVKHDFAINSATGTRTRVARVRAEYPNQLDYSGFCWLSQGGAKLALYLFALWFEREKNRRVAHITPCGTRTHNLRIRSPTPCPLGQGGSTKSSPSHHTRIGARTKMHTQRAPEQKLLPAGFEPATYGS